jgi:hypothetical protein
MYKNLNFFESTKIWIGAPNQAQFCSQIGGLEKFGPFLSCGAYNTAKKQGKFLTAPN